MSSPSSGASEVIVQRSEMGPSDPKDSRNWWQKFRDGVRQTIGLKPLYLAERYAVARVQQEEVEAKAKLLAAQADYERSMAEVRRLDAATHSIEIKNEMVRRLYAAKHENPEGIIETIDEIIKKIEFEGGRVESDVEASSVDSSAAVIELKQSGKPLK